MRSLQIVCLSLAASAAYADGLIIDRTKAGISFLDAMSVNVNDKDKALSLGSQPKISGPVNKLPSVRLAALLIRDTNSGTVLIYSPGQPPQYLLPQGVDKKTQPNPADVWKTARLTYRKSQSEKTPVEVPRDEFLGFIPDGVPGLVSLCMDPVALGLIGGKDGYFPAQIEIVAAAVKAFGSNPAMATIERYVRDTMRGNLDRFDNGVESAKSLDQGLQFATLSEHAYSGDPVHQELRKTLAERKTTLERRMAILRALSAASEWDTFILAYRNFEKHQSSFPDLRERRHQALQESLKWHRTQGKERLGRREYQSAYRELRLASYREPANAALQNELSVSWSEYSREVAGSRRARRNPLTPGQQDAVTQAIHFATRYKEQNKLDEALKSIKEAEIIDSENLSLLLKKAEVYGVLGEFGQALTTLDKYDQLAVDEERAPGTKLRNELSFQVLNSVRDQKSKLEAAWARRQFNLTRTIALDTLRNDARDPDILYFAGMASLVTRDPKSGREFLARFLENSNTINANEERRATALRLVAPAKDDNRKAADQGDPNWFSGKRLPPNVMYCPISVAFGARVERIDASHKLTVRYEWANNRLKEIVPAFDKPQNATGETTIHFTYESSIPQVIAVQPEGGPAPGVTTDRDELLKRSSVLLSNSPLVDPIALERVTGQKVAIGVAGNRFFNPFVWQKVHYFQLTYDDAERVKFAREIGGPDAQQGGEVDLEFEWDGLKLMSIHGYQRGADEAHRTKIYERSMEYQDNRLMGEEIRSNGKPSHIKYVYDGATLVSAHCDKDDSIDGRSRDVFFAATASRPRRR